MISHVHTHSTCTHMHNPHMHITHMHIMHIHSMYMQHTPVTLVLGRHRQKILGLASQLL